MAFSYKKGKQKNMPKSPDQFNISVEQKAEVEKEQKTKILILEDEFGAQAKEGLNLPCFETQVVSSIEELENIEPEFKPDIVILDLHVPNKKGEEAISNDKISTKIIKEKYKDTPVFYYTSYTHSGHKQGGVGDSPEDARDFYLFFYNEQAGRAISEKYPEMRKIPDKSNPENWQRILEILPIVSNNFKFLTEKLRLFKFWPDELKEKIIAMYDVTNPEMATSLKRAWKNTKNK